MSSYKKRNLIPLEKIQLPKRLLPEIVKENLETSISDYENSSKKEYTSSASSYRYRNQYYKYKWPSISGIDSPEFIEFDSSGSSASSAFSWVDLEQTKQVAEEWEKIERTLYNEDGSKVTQQHLLDECNQWKQIFPHLRVIGKKCKLNDPHYNFKNNDSLLHHRKNEIAKRNKRNISYENNSDLMSLNGKKKNSINSSKIMDKIDSLFHINSINSFKNSQMLTDTSSIIRSELSSSRWRCNNVQSPDFLSLPHQIKDCSISHKSTGIRDNSATSLYSYSSKSNHNEIKSLKSKFSSIEKKTHTSKFKTLNDNTYILEPLEPITITKIISQSTPFTSNTKSRNGGILNNKNTSLPPLVSGENNVQGNINSSKKEYRRNISLTPIEQRIE